MFTSFYANVKNLPASVEPVCISLGKPKWFTGRAEKSLAPSRAMLSMTKAEYDWHYQDLLAKLDPREVYRQLGDNAVLLCWERPGEACHRRQVAEWLERALGIEIPEYGLTRAQTLAYDASKWTGVKVAVKQPRPRKARRPEPSGLFLF